MEYFYSFSDEKKLVSISQQDLYSFNDVIHLIDKIINDPRYKPTYNFIIDLRNIKHTPVVREMHELADYIISIEKYFKGSTAIVTDNEVHHYLFKLAMTIVATKTGIQSRMFHNSDQALDWLNDINISEGK